MGPLLGQALNPDIADADSDLGGSRAASAGGAAPAASAGAATVCLPLGMCRLPPPP